ncbi:MAG: methyltransferase type 11 [Gammaproteobacteria bacterium]|nr:MAG: methyltransferase type 11 [Gammaproteobacteria bacterium]RLA51873.1 MAG: methyltransferase type 11 [Gammaproteobacteria bacterium]
MSKVFAALSLIIISLAIYTPIHAETNEDAVNNPARSDADRERDKTSKPTVILEFFGVKPGMKVLDLFAGGGYYSEILAYAVGPDGHVISHTNKAYESSTGEEATLRFKDNRLPNISRLTSEIDNLGLENDSLDMVVMVLTYHDIYFTADYWPQVDRDNFFKQIRDSLKPGGVLAIIDHAANSMTASSAAQDLHRIEEGFAKQDIESAGFTFEGQSEVLRNPDDKRTLSVFDDNIRRRTDRFVYRFVK